MSILQYFIILFFIMKKIFISLLISLMVYSPSFAYVPTAKDNQLIIQLENIVDKLYSEDKFKDKRIKLMEQITIILKNNNDWKIKLSERNIYILNKYVDLATEKLNENINEIKEKLEESWIIDLYDSGNWTISIQAMNEEKDNEYIEIWRNWDNYNIDYYTKHKNGEKTLMLSEQWNAVIDWKDNYNLYISCFNYSDDNIFCVNITMPTLNKDDTIFNWNITGAILWDVSLVERKINPIKRKFNILSTDKNLLIDSTNWLQSNLEEEVVDKVQTDNHDTEYDTIIEQKCTADWPDDFSMRAYCEDKQYEWVRKLNLWKPSDIIDSDFNLIRNKCIADWPDDFSMRAYCENKQYEGIRELNLWKPSDITNNEFTIVRNKCTADWPDDFSMRVYCENKQYEGIRALK